MDRKRTTKWRIFVILVIFATTLRCFLISIPTLFCSVLFCLLCSLYSVFSVDHLQFTYCNFASCCSELLNAESLQFWCRCYCSRSCVNTLIKKRQQRQKAELFHGATWLKLPSSYNSSFLAFSLPSTYLSIYLSIRPSSFGHYLCKAFIALQLVS